MEFGILGPLEVIAASGDTVALGGARARAVFAVLLLHANEPVSAEQLAVALWGDDAPPGAIKTVQVHVSRLRKALGDSEMVQTTPAGYRLRVLPGELDAERFDELVDAGRRALADEEPQLASSLLRDALGLWRGPPLSDLAHEPFAAAEVRRLEERRLAATELAMESDLADGRHGEVVGELEALVAEHPLRERLHAQRMLALYRCGRQAEALQAFRDARRLLVEEIGVEPGAALRDLHESILRQDASLDLEPRVAALPRELDAMASQPMVGRKVEVAWLRERWERARAGRGELIVVTGERGIGKTRLAAELAREVHRGGATVRYATGRRRSEVVAAIRDVREATRPTLLVVDDADADGGAIGELGELGRELTAAPVLALAMAEAEEAEARLGIRSLLALEPLDADGVRRIALLYAPNHAAGSIPVEELAGASRGLPGRVHELASGWARREAQRRVAAEAKRTEAGRSELRSAEEELAGGVIDLQETRPRTPLASEHEGPVVCPFKGLASFDVADAGYFFGRERLVAELVARLVGAPLLGVVGPSGSGKSSVVRAGLVPALAGGVLPGSDEWSQVVIRPGEHPLQELARAMAGVRPDRRVVLVVDQFEELFTVCRDERERGSFVDALVHARSDRAPRVVVLAVRADLYGRCATYPALSDLLGAHHVLVGPMRGDELRRAIELPARRAGLQVEPELVDALVRDVEDEPGALPLLSSALLELWQGRDGRYLRRAVYERAGGVRGAVARLAEAAFERLDPAEQGVARTVLLRLAGTDVGGAPVRRPVALEELQGLGGERLERVLEVLAERRLVTISAAAIEVAHEALLSEWPRLRGWLEEDAQGRGVQRHLADAARDWDERGRDRGDVYRGARLAAALEWRAGHEQELNRTERVFLDASRAEAGRAQRRLRMVLMAVAALLAVAVAGGLVALDQRGSARDEARTAEAQRLGVQALSEPRLDRALLLARQGVELDDTLTTRSNLLEALLRSPGAVRVIPGDGSPLDSLDLSPDGRTLAVGDNRGDVLFFDAATGQPAGRPHKALSAVSALRFSPDGTRVAVAGVDSVDILDARTHRAVRSGLVAEPPSASGLVNFPVVLGTIAFTPDSRVLAADVIRNEPRRRSADIVRWDARTGRRLGRPRQVAPTPEPTLVGFTARGARLVTSSVAERVTVIRDAVTLRPLRRLQGGGSPSALSPDGRVVALGAADGSVRLLDLRTGKLRVATGLHEGAVTDLRFTRDSRTLLTAGADARLSAWNIADARRVATFTGHARTVSRVAIAPDSRTAYGAGQDGTVIAFDLTGDRSLDRPFTAPPRHVMHIPVFLQGKDAADLAPDGPSLPYEHLGVATTRDRTSFAVPDEAGYVDVFDARTLTQTGRIPVAPGTQVSAVALAPDGRTIAATTTHGQLRFGDVRDHRPLGPSQPVYDDLAWSLAFGGDGRWLATAGMPGPALRLWDVRRRRIVSTYESPEHSVAADVAFSPDGTRLAAPMSDPKGTAGSGIEILSIPRLAHVTTVRAPAGRSLQFSSDGRLLVFGDDQGRVWRYDTRTWTPYGRPLVAHAGAVDTVDISPDGQTLATTSGDGATRLWDLPSGRPVGAALQGHAGHDLAAAFVDDGTHLVTLHDNGRGSVWDVQPRSWARRACQVAGRTLTREEWDDALPEHKYAPACATH